MVAPEQGRHYFNHALITGISGEVGFNIAKYLIEHNLVGTLSVCSRSEHQDKNLMILCGDKVTLNIGHFDIKDDQSLQEFIERAYKLCPVDLVIANAGVSLSKDQNGLEDLYEINRAFDINSKATIKTLYFVLNLYQNTQDFHIKSNHHLHLVAISSLASLLPMGGSPLYVASKSAINSYIKAIDNSLSFQQLKKVKTTLVLAGFIKSAMSDRYIGGKSSMYTAEKAAKIIVLGILKGKRQIAFPLYLYCLIKLYNLLPRFIAKFFNRFLDFQVQADKDRQSFLQQRK